MASIIKSIPELTGNSAKIFERNKNKVKKNSIDFSEEIKIVQKILKKEKGTV